MPIFEYICQKCQTVSEFILMASDPRPTKCPACGGKLHKRLSAPAIQFKGSGWYVTDYAKRPTDATASKAKTLPAESAPAGEKKEAPAKSQDAPSGKKEPAASKKEN